MKTYGRYFDILLFLHRMRSAQSLIAGLKLAKLPDRSTVSLRMGRIMQCGVLRPTFHQTHTAVLILQIFRMD